MSEVNEEERNIDIDSEEDKRKTDKKIIHVMIAVSALFLSLISFLLYINLFKTEEYAQNPYNPRQWSEERHIKRGDIFDKNGVVLATSEFEDEGVQRRIYPEGNLYSHIIGYSSRVYGKSNLEMEYNSELLGKNDFAISFDNVKQGSSLNLTIDNRIQKYAREQMKGRKGAVVAINPSTGEIIAMVSLPDYDPSSEALEEEWKNLAESEDYALLPRATQGLYAPGSTFKILTSAAAYENNLEDTVLEDTGGFEKDGIKVANYNDKVYGEMDLKQSFEVSSNQMFCELAYNMGGDTILEMAERFGINKEIKFDLKTEKSRIEYDKMYNMDAAMVGIGQGKLLVTPLQMAMIGSAVANDGIMMKPYLVDSVERANGTVISETQIKSLGKVLDYDTAAFLKELMVVSVEAGTSVRASIRGIQVAGKTGTAENETNKTHSWFVGFAPAERAEICVAVILEYDGTTGGSTAAPIGGNVMKKYLETVGKN